MTPPRQTALWIYEHGEEYAVPAAEIEAAGLLDVSWHNDTCPSFAVELPDPIGGDMHDLRLWVEHPDPEQRETFERFAVNYQPWSNEPVPGLLDAEHGELYEGDDLDAALAAYRDALAKIRAEIERRAEVSRRG